MFLFHWQVFLLHPPPPHFPYLHSCSHHSDQYCYRSPESKWSLSRYSFPHTLKQICLIKPLRQCEISRTKIWILRPRIWEQDQAFFLKLSGQCQSSIINRKQGEVQEKSCLPAPREWYACHITILPLKRNTSKLPFHVNRACDLCVDQCTCPLRPIFHQKGCVCSSPEDEVHPCKPGCPTKSK